MITADQPVKFNERTGRAVLMRVGLFAAFAGVGDLAFLVGYGWPNFALAYYPILCVVGCVAQLSVATEWTVAGGQLERRRWLSGVSRKPEVVALGPQVEVVRESWGRWRMRPYRFLIDVQPWQTPRFTGFMQRAGVRLNDWRGDWGRRHRLLNALGLLAYCGGAVAVFAAIALAPMRPSDTFGVVAFGASVGAFCLGFAVDFLPWTMRKRSAPDSQPRA